MTKEVIRNEERQNHSAEFKARIALDAIREQLTLATEIEKLYATNGP